MSEERDRVNELGRKLTKLRTNDGSLVIAFEVIPEDPDSEEDYFKVTVKDLYYEASGSAIGLYDAIYMAQAKLQAKHRDAEKLEAQISVVKVPVGQISTGEKVDKKPAPKLQIKGPLQLKKPLVLKKKS
jgi:hypothetical protein